MGEEMFREGCDETDQTCVLNDNYDAGADMEKSDLESSFYYSQHPLVVSIQYSQTFLYCSVEWQGE